jgi:hypothetical protein
VGELVQKSNFDEGYIDIANYLNHTDGKMVFEFDNTKSIHTLHLAANGQEVNVQRMLKRFTYVIETEIFFSLIFLIKQREGAKLKTINYQLIN